MGDQQTNPKELGSPISTSTIDGLIRNRQVDPEGLIGGPWNGKVYSYVPPVELDIDPSVELHREFNKEIDPVTYQVLRSRFWNMNLDHSDTIKRVSGSPLIVYMDDFNTSLLTEDGDNIVCGPSVQYFTGHGDLVVKWTLENRSANPGIEEGDVFLQNDPYIGTQHQMDTVIYEPLFWEGKLFSWILSSCHMGDIGGVDPGSFCAEAPDMFHESTPVPPIKLVRKGVTQVDVADMFIRKSRTPDMVALQIRSQLAGLRLTKERMLELLQEHGAGVIKGTMRRIIRDCSEAVSRRLLRIPDGEWQETIFVGSAGPNDRDVHRLVTRVKKEGDRLIFSNAGSDPQFFAANGTFSAWRSGIICAGSNLLAFDQSYCPAGVADHMEFQPTPGTMTVATYPGAVTPLTASIVSVYLASQAISKMVLAGPADVREVANATGGISLPGWWVASGTDRHGNFVADLTGDSLMGSIGAFPYRDGVDTGGAWWWPRSTAGNLEEWEASLPILYLYRREQIDSGGAGRWRGGNGLEKAIIMHKTDDLNAQIIATDPAINTSPGLAGGMPGHPGNHMIVRDSAIREVMAKGQIPTNREDLEALVGATERLSPKTNRPLSSGDVFALEYTAGGGFGDALHRDPSHVQEDVARHQLTRDAAKSKYGVAIASDGQVDSAATERLRADERARRLADAIAPISNGRGTFSLEEVHQIGDSLGIAFSANGDASWACVDCGHDLAAAKDNFKQGAALIQVNPSAVDAIMYPDPSDFSDVDFVMRQFLCPNCGTLLSVECCRGDDEPSFEFSFTERGLAFLAAST
jgi:N-methylhydantoinase B